MTNHPKDCRQCGKVFTPARSTQVICSPRCATKMATASAKAKKTAERELTKARRESLKTIADRIKEAQTEFNAYIRLRDQAQPCICCGRTANDRDLITGSRWDAGHYRSTGSASHLRFNEDNCHRQLVVCNRHGAGRAVDYRIGLVKRIGLERVEALESNNAQHKWSHGELIQILATYKAKRKALEAKPEPRAATARISDHLSF
jgi:hypothetical protein